MGSGVAQLQPQRLAVTCLRLFAATGVGLYESEVIVPRRRLGP